MAPGSRTPAEAVEHYRGLTARLLGCLTSEYVVVSAYHTADPPHQLELLDLAKLRAAHPLRLSVGEHVATDIHVGERWFGKVHLPTGVVGLERVVALAITELGARPLRDDWERVIAEAADR